MLTGKTVIVTGGTRGIGFAAVETFLKNGANVALLGSRSETVDHALALLKEKDNSYVERTLGFYPNLMDPAAVADTFAKVKSTFGSLDVLVNNAGVSASEPIYNYDPEDFNRTIDLNLNSAFICSQAAAKIMKPQGGGVIVNISSMVSLYGQPAGCAYPASKYAINGMTKSLARELGRDNIRVNAVAPGITKTDMVAAIPDEMIQPLIRSIPLHRIGEPEEIASAILFLASDMSSYVTGAILSVDGAAMC